MGFAAVAGSRQWCGPPPKRGAAEVGAGTNARSAASRMGAKQLLVKQEVLDFAKKAGLRCA